MIRSLALVLFLGLLFAPTVQAERRAPPSDPKLPVRQPPEFSNFDPPNGPPGTVVNLKGRFFDENTKVRFNGRWLAIVNRGPEHLKVKIPDGAVSDNFVIVKAGFPDVPHDKQFFVVRPASISTYSPRQGGPGTEVAIEGQNFLPKDEFVLGGAVLRVVSIRNEQAVVRIVEGASTGKISVRRGGNVIATSTHPFTVIGRNPIIHSFSPERGERGTVVRITGENFSPGDWVELAGSRLPIKGRGPTHFEVVIGNQPSDRFVVAGAGGRRGESQKPFTLARQPVVTSFSPTFGPTGTRITVEGMGFVAGDQVLVGDGMLTIRTINDTRIVAEIPPGVQGGPVGIQRGGKRFPAKGKFEVILPPTITSIEPPGGPPGAKVIIRGRHFLSDVSVVLAGETLPIASKSLPGEVVVTIPPGSRSGRLVVVTRAGSASSPIRFEVAQFATLTSFFPLHGLPGVKVTLRGTSFMKGVKVSLGDSEVPILQHTPESLVVEIPEGAHSGKFVIDSFGRKLQSQMPFKVDEAKAEVEFTFVPPSGRRGSEVTLLLDPPREEIQVFFDERPLPKRTLEGGHRVIVTIPGDARTSHFEIEFNGKRYRSKHPFKVR